LKAIPIEKINEILIFCNHVFLGHFSKQLVAMSNEICQIGNGTGIQYPDIRPKNEFQSIPAYNLVSGYHAKK
jgi:hypothetical protein